MFGFSLDENTPQSPAPSTQQAANYLKLRGQKYIENSQRILTCISEGITTSIYGITFNLTCSPQYTNWFEQLHQNWSPIIPNLKFDMDLVSSPRTSQSSQFSNSMPSPTTDAASNQNLADTPILLQESSTNVRQQAAITSSGYLLPPRSHNGLQEVLRTIPFSFSPPRLFHPTSMPMHSYFTLSIYPYHCHPPPLPPPPSLMTSLTFVQ